jgi:WD40 repeat protein
MPEPVDEPRESPAQTESRNGVPVAATSGTASGEASSFAVFLSHNSRDKPAVERLAERLKREGLEPWLDAWSLTVGGRWQDELAEGVKRSSAFAFFVGPHGDGDWAREELAIAQDRAVKDRDGFRMFPVLLPGLPEPFPADSLPPFLRMRTWVDLRAGLDSTEGLQALICAITGVPFGPRVPIAARDDVCPYRGLTPFDEGDAEFFFGRDAEVQRLLEQLKTTRFLAVLGASGSGKSSVVRAGLIPALRGGLLPESWTWPVCVVKPGVRPLTELATQLTLLNPRAPITDTLDRLVRDHRALDLSSGLVLAGQPDAARLVCVIDQFEEVFTLCSDERERQALFANLLYASTVPGGRTVVVLMMRADFYHRCAAYPELAAALASHQFLVSPMGREDLRLAIVEPARRVGLSFEAGLVETVLDDVADRPGTLPLLEHALLELWERRHGALLTLEGYRGSGGVDGAIAQRADEVYATLDPAQQGIARRVLLRLTQPGDGTEDTRRRATLGEMIVRQDEQAAVEQVVRALTDARLLITTGDAQSDDSQVDLAHEALIRCWPRLKGWIDEDRAALRVHRRLTEAATEWQRLQPDEGLLYRGVRLAEAVEWRDHHDAELNPVERAFLDASVTAREGERREAVERQRREVEAAQRLAAEAEARRQAEESARRAAEEQVEERSHAARRLKFRAWLLAGAAAVALVAFVVAFVQGQAAVAGRNAAIAAQATAESAEGAAQTSAEAARSAQATAETNASIAATNEAVAQSERQRADQRARETRLALAGQLAERAKAAQQEHPQLGLLLSVEALRTLDRDDPPVPSSEEALRAALARTGGRVVRGQPGSLNTVATSSDGHWLAGSVDSNGATSGAVYVWDLTQPDPISKPMQLPDALGPIAFTPDSHQLLTSSTKNAVRVWNLQAMGTPTGFEALSAQEQTITTLAISPDGHWLLTSAGVRGPYALGHSTRLWDLTAANVGESRRDLPGHTRVVTVAVFSADSHRLATASDESSSRSGPFDPVIRVWDLTGPDPAADVLALSGHEGPVRRLSFSADGHLLASGGGGIGSGGLDTTVRLWDLTSQTPTEPLDVIDRKQTIGLAAISAGNRWLVTASPTLDPTTGSARRRTEQFDVRIRDLKDRAQAEQTTEIPATQFAMSPDGRWLAGASGSDVLVWDLTAATPLARARTLHGHEGSVVSLAFSPDSTGVITSGDDRAVRLWHLSSVESAANPTGFSTYSTENYLRNTMSPDSHWLVTVPNLQSGRAEFSAQLWDLRLPNPGAQPIILGGHKGQLYKTTFSDDSRWLATTDHSGGVRLWDLTASPPRPTDLSGHTQAVSAAAFSSDRRWLITGDFKGELRRWDLSNPTSPAYVWTGHRSAIFGAEISPDGQWLFTRANDEADNRLWSLTAQDPASTARPLAGRWVQATFSADAHWLITAGRDGLTHLWDLTLANPTSQSRELVGARTPLAISADGHWLATASPGTDVQLWNLASADPTCCPRAFSTTAGRVTSIAFSDDARLMAVGTDLGAIRIWNPLDTQTTPRQTLTGHQASVTDLAFSPDQRWLLSASFYDHTARLWGPLLPENQAIVARVLPDRNDDIPPKPFSNDHQWLVTVSYDDKIGRLWRLPLDDLVGIACRTAGRNLGRKEWDQYFPGQAYRSTCPDLPPGDESAPDAEHVAPYVTAG